MLLREIAIVNDVGLHARPATFFIQKANSYKASIWIEKEDRRVNAKSLLGVLSMGIVKGTVITLIADGEDEAEAIDGLEKLIAKAPNMGVNFTPANIKTSAAIGMPITL